MAKSSFKDENDIDKRLAEASSIRDKYPVPDRIPVIVEKSEKSDIPNIDRKKYQSNSLMLRYATLQSNELFHRLCTLYTRLFNAHWPHFKRLAESFELQAGYTDHKAYLAAVYVSSWFWDLYVSIRASVEKISSTAVTEYFHTQQAHISERYDSFLAHLNSVIRPVHLKLALEDALWIPRICVRYQWTTGNPFQITNFTLNENLMEGIIELLDAKNKRFKLENLTSYSLGRPMWLLDWNADQAYAWFPCESNFTREDLVAPYIVGIPCTPNLGPRDEDEWQFFPGGSMPAEIRMPARITNRKFYGSAEFRTCQTDWWDIPYTTLSGRSKRRHIEKSTSGGASTHDAAEPNELQITMPGTDQDTQMTPITIPVRVARFRVIDWCYYARVVLALNAQIQNAAFRNFITKHD